MLQSRTATPSPAATRRPAGAPRAVRPPLGRELVLALAVLALYSAVARVELPNRQARGDAHALQVLHVERLLHLDVEHALNQMLVPHRLLRTGFNYEYATTYAVAAFAVLFWVLVRRPAYYRWARTSFVLVNIGGVCVFALWPLTPPRLLPGAGYTDTVLLDHTHGSWGSPLIEHANHLAAMPSLHVAWAVWISAVLGRLAVRPVLQFLSAGHVLLTIAVIVCTANHWLLDAAAGAVLVAVCARATDALQREGEPVASEDAFFLHVETDHDPQHVGGVVVLDVLPGGPPTQAQVQDLVRRQLDALPRFTQLLEPGGWWRAARWVPATRLDWDWHVPHVDLAGGGQPALERLVADIAATRLPLDRPLWRLHVVHGIDAQTWAVVLVLHHVVADGLGTVMQAMQLLEPPYVFPMPPAPPAVGPLRRVAAVTAGIAQLAADAGHQPARIDASGGGPRTFGGTSLPLAEARAAARGQGVRMTDLLLAAVAGALARTGRGLPDDVRVTVPLVVRPPGTAATGNLTAAAFVDLPVGPAAATERLAAVVDRARRLRSPTRVAASRWVMTMAGHVLPPGLHGAFARAVYGPGFFAGIVSNMPGPDIAVRLLGSPVRAAYPLLPLAPRTAFVVGVLGVSGGLHLGVVADAEVADAGALAGCIVEEIGALAGVALAD